MTLTELRYIIALDKERNFGRAAKRCFVSQPTLSIAVKKLEEELDITIFERSRGEAKVTPVGRKVIDQAYRVLGEVAMLEAVAEQGKDELKGTLRLGVIYTVGPYLLPELIPRLHEDAPDMPIVLEENFTNELSQQLRNNELDAIIVALPFSDAIFSTWALYDEPFVVALPNEHEWAKKDAIDANELASENLLLLGPGHCFRDQVLQACTDCYAGKAENLPRTGSSLETIRHMVASGLGITVLPQSSVAQAREKSLLVTKPFEGPAPSRRIALAWRKNFPRQKAIKAIRQAVIASQLKGTQLLPDAEINNN